MLQQTEYDRLTILEQKAEAQRDSHQDRIEQIIGRELTGMELARLRYEFRMFEAFEDDMTRISDRIQNLR